MRICLIGKYPPLEGQVSTIAYWLSRGLARRGHLICACTDAFDAPEPFRTFLLDDDAGQLEGSFGAGKISVLRTDAFDRTQFYVVPRDPVVTKLTALGLQAVREHGCEIVLSNYLEPYGIAAHLMSTWTAVPHVQTHAGSDVGRLASHRQLRPVYGEIARRCRMFVAKNAFAKSLATPSGPVTAPEPYAPPPEIFSPECQPLDVGDALHRARETIVSRFQWHASPFDTSCPIIGFYGKLFEAKGIFDLIRALAMVKAQGFRFNLLLMTGWHRGEDLLRRAIAEADLTERTWLLPMLANWHVAGFIRACTAVAYLNRDFGTAGHVPIIPDEVLACGGCLLVSGEVRRLSRYRDLLHDGRSCVLVNDPREHVILADAIKRILTDPAAAARIGAAGHAAIMRHRSHEAFLDSWERILGSARDEGDRLTLSPRSSTSAPRWQCARPAPD